MQCATAVSAPGLRALRIPGAVVVVQDLPGVPRRPLLQMATNGPRWPHSVLLLVGALAVSGCVTLTNDAGFSAVRTLTKDRTGYEPRWERTQADSDAVTTTIREILARPLSVTDVVQIALINNRGLQATYAEVGIGETELVQASWPRNPGFVFSHLQGGGDKEVERSFTLELVSLLTIPLRARLERDRLTATQLAVAAQALDVAAQARRAYFRAIAAEQSAQYMEQVQVAAEAGAELGRRMARAGNWSKLDQAREQSFYAEAVAGVARARQAAVSEREKLVRILGLSDADTQLKLSDRLPDLPAGVTDSVPIEARALADRLDVQAAKKEVEGLATSLGLTKTTRFINLLEAGYRTKSETGMPLKRGYEVSVELPLFDWSGAKVARAEYIYMQGVNRAAEVAINARSEVREAYAAYRSAYEVARHYRDQVVPLRKQISDENQLRYNGMLVSVFELLADAREQASAVNGSIEALRDFWLADTELQVAMAGSSSALARAAARARAD